MIRSCHCNEGWREVPGLSACLVPNDQPLSAAILALLVEVPDLGSELHPSNIFITFALLHCTWWRHLTFSALLPLRGGSPPVTGGFSSQGPVTRSFDVFFDLRLNKRLSKQCRRRRFETPSRSDYDVTVTFCWNLILIPLTCINSLPSNGANYNHIRQKWLRRWLAAFGPKPLPEPNGDLRLLAFHHLCDARDLW